MGGGGAGPVKQPWYTEFGPIFVRLIIGCHLVYGSWGGVAHHKDLMIFQAYLANHHFPLPLLCAYVSSIAQVVCGYCYMLGLFTRPAAAVMVINLIVAHGALRHGVSEAGAGSDAAVPLDFPAAARAW